MNEQHQAKQDQELLKVVDPETGEFTGEQLPRQQVFAENRWARTTNVYVINSKGEVLCHQRALNKESHPGVWITHFGGHVGGEDTYEESARVELMEEIGLDVPVEKLVPWRTSRKAKARRWMRDFVTVCDEPLENLRFQKEEIAQIQWVAPTDILERLDNEDIEDAENWLAGTHNFKSDYQCMRAVLTAAFHLNVFGDAYHHLSSWAPARKTYSI